MNSKEEALKKHREQIEKATKERQGIRAEAQATAHTEIAATRKYIEAQVGKQGWIEHVYPCIVKGIPEKNVAIVEAGFLGGLTKALFGKSRPILDRQYELRWPSSGALPWIKVPGNKRWLYQKVYGKTKLVRWEWPPPVRGSGDWVREEVATVMKDSVLLGGMTRLDHPTDIVLRDDNNDTKVLMQGAARETPPPNPSIYEAPRCRLIIVPVMGLLEPLTPYVLNPNTAQVDAISNDGTSIIGHDIRYERRSGGNLGGSGIDSFESVLSASCCMTNPITNQQDCLQQYNSQPIIGSHTPPPVIYTLLKGAHFLFGQGVSLNQEDWVFPFTVSLLQSPGGVTDYAYSWTSVGSCEYFLVGGLPVFLRWSSVTNELRHVFLAGAPSEGSYMLGTVLNVGAPRTIFALQAGVWGSDEEDEIVSRAWVYSIQDQSTYFQQPTPTHPHPEDSLPSVKVSNFNYCVRGIQCNPSTETRLGKDVYPRALAMDDDKDLIVWGDSHTVTLNGPEYTGWKWTAKSPGWEKKSQAGQIIAVSRDGKDILSIKYTDWDTVNWIASDDEGESWEQVASPVSLTNPGDDIEGFMFIDEIT